MGRAGRHGSWAGAEVEGHGVLEGPSAGQDDWIRAHKWERGGDELEEQWWQLSMAHRLLQEFCFRFESDGGHW